MKDAQMSLKRNKQKQLSKNIASTKSFKEDSFSTMNKLFKQSSKTVINIDNKGRSDSDTASNKIPKSKKRKNDFNTNIEIKSKEFSENNSMDFMNRLEDFSDVWNDCPVIKNSAFISHSNTDTHEINPKRFKHKQCEEYNTVRNLTDLEDGNNDCLNKDLKCKKTNNKPKRNDTELADYKRKEAINKQKQFHDDKKKIIKHALSTLEGERINKKIVFNYDDDDIEKKNKHLQLFEDDDEVDAELKLRKIKSNCANDSRFTLDTRFYESGSEPEGDDNPDGENEVGEKEKLLAILGSIVNKEIKPLSEVKKSLDKQAKQKWMVRYDPTREDHKYLLKSKTQVKTDDVEQKAEKKKDKKNKKEEHDDIIVDKRPVISDDKFYSVKDDLKEVLNKENKTEFSLLKLFGTKDVPDSIPEIEETEEIKEKNNIKTKKFKYQSSDSEDETPPVLTQNEQKPISWRTTVFFTENDSRIKDAFEFYKAPIEEEDSKEFAEKRKLLKDFIKNKYKNSYRKNNVFKKKLGGFKRKSISRRKPTNKSSLVRT